MKFNRNIVSLLQNDLVETTETDLLKGSVQDQEEGVEEEEGAEEKEEEEEEEEGAFRTTETEAIVGE